MTTEKRVKRIAFLLFCLMLLAGLCACGTSNRTSDKSADTMEFEPLEWPTYDNAKQIPIPKSSMAYVRNLTSMRFEFYLADTTVDDYQSYVDECKTMGFVVDAIEQDTRYHAFNEAEYELTVQYQEGDIMYVEVFENRPDVEIKLLHTDKTSADMYNLRVEIDGFWEADSEKGVEAVSFDSYLKEGTHVLRVENDDEDSINGRIEFTVSKDGEYIEFEIECFSNRIDIRQISGTQTEDADVQPQTEPESPKITSYIDNGEFTFTPEEFASNLDDCLEYADDDYGVYTGVRTEDNVVASCIYREAADSVVCYIIFMRGDNEFKYESSMSKTGADSLAILFDDSCSKEELANVLPAILQSVNPSLSAAEASDAAVRIIGDAEYSYLQEGEITYVLIDVDGITDDWNSKWWLYVLLDE